MCVCVCVWVGGWVGMCVCVCVCVEMANKPAPVGIARTCPRFDGESPH